MKVGDIIKVIKEPFQNAHFVGEIGEITAIFESDGVICAVIETFATDDINQILSGFACFGGSHFTSPLACLKLEYAEKWHIIKEARDKRKKEVFKINMDYSDKSNHVRELVARKFNITKKEVDKIDKIINNEYKWDSFIKKETNKD